MMAFFERYHWLGLTFGFMALIYLVAFSLSPKAVFWSPDEGARLFYIQTLQWDNGLTYQIPYPGLNLDPEYRFYPYHPEFRPIYPHRLPNGQVRFHWPIWFFLISWPFYQWFGLPGLYIIPLLSGLLITALSGWLCFRLMPASGPIAMVAVGLATPIFIYSLLFWEHTLVVLLALIAVGLVMQGWQIRSGYRWSLLLAVLCLAVAIAMRPEMLFFGLALLLAAAIGLALHRQNRQGFRHFLTRHWRWLITGGIILTVAVWLVGQPPLLGNPLSPRYLEHLNRTARMLNDPTLAQEFMRQLPDFLISTSYDFGPPSPPVLVGLGFTGLLMSALAVFAPDRHRIWLLTAGGVLMGLVSLYAFFQPARYRIHSLFLPAPYLIFMFLAISYARQQKRLETTVLVTTTLLYLIFGTIGIMLRGGVWNSINTEWGPRYMLMFYPLAGMCAALGAYHFYQTRTAFWEKWLWLVVSAALLVIGLEFSVRGWSEVQTTKADMQTYAAVLQSVEQPVVTDLTWLPGLLATRFVDQEIYALSETADLEAWVTLAAAQQVESFVLVTNRPLASEMVQALASSIKLKGEHADNGLIFAEFQILSD